MKLLIFVEDSEKRILMDESIDLDKKFNADGFEYVLPEGFSMDKLFLKISRAAKERRYEDKKLSPF